MNIGIIGIGVVGSAIKYGFEKLGHKVSFYDINYDTKIEDVLDTEVCFICVPTPSEESGRCNVSIVEDVVRNLQGLNYTGAVAIKSTVEPGTTERLRNLTGMRLCFVPEFLRERCAITDFTENHDVCIIGTEDEEVYNKVKEVHGRYPKKFIKLTSTEAELSKHFNNAYNATLVTFANSFFEVCKFCGADYSKIKDAMVNRDHITDIYLDCNNNIRGFGGMCLPKDLKAIDFLCEKNKTDVAFFKYILSENDKYITTVFDGMRKN